MPVEKGKSSGGDLRIRLVALPGTFLWDLWSICSWDPLWRAVGSHIMESLMVTDWGGDASTWDFRGIVF